MKKRNKIIACTVMFTMLGGAMTSFAGEWKTDAKGYWYAKDNGGYAASEWLEDKGKWYYIGDDGYMVSNAWIGNYYVGEDGAMLTNTTTPDGYQVGADGAWIQDNNVQAGYLEKYAEVLRNVLNGVPQGGYMDGHNKYGFQLVYVDGDAIPELVLLGWGYSYRRNTRLYTYYQGNACVLNREWGPDFSDSTFSYVNQGNYINSQYIGSGSSIGSEYFYHINDRKFVTLAEFSPANGYYGNRINGNEVSQSTYDRQLNEMKAGYSFRDVTTDTVHELTEENIQKMLADMNSAM